MWQVEVLDETVQAELDTLPADMLAHLLRIVDLVQTHGLERIREPYIKHLDGKLWEMRLRGKSGIGRVIYLTISGKRIILLHAFIKKTQRTPKQALQLAQQRMQEIKK